MSPQNETPVVVISGAAGGVGRAVARRFHASGWRIAALDQRDDGLQTLAAEVPTAASVAADLRGADACRHAIAEVVRQCGRIDALVNAIGVWREGPVEDADEADFDLVLAVNLKAPFFLCSAAIPHLKATRGSIVNVSSDAGHQGNQNAAIYCASKGGLTLLSKTLALDLAPYGVRVNSVSPGDINTPMLRFQAERYGGGDVDGYLQGLLAKYPQGAGARFIEAEEVAELIHFLCQPAARAITGADLAIDMGLSTGI